MMPYFGKREQVTKVTFLVKEQNVSVISTDINKISWCLTYIVAYLLAGWVYMCVAQKFGLEEEHTW